MGGVFAGGPRTDDRVPVVAASAYAYAGDERTRFVGELYACAPGTTEHDLPLASAVRLQGGSYWTEGATVGDRVSLLVVDVDDVLGGGAGAVVSEYVQRLPVAPWQQQVEVMSPTAALVPAGLYLRVKYENVGASDVSLGVTYRWLVQP